MTFSCLKYHFFLEVKIKVTTFVVAKTPCYAFDCSGCSTVGSAPRSGRGGRKFESSHPDIKDRYGFLPCLSFIYIIRKICGTVGPADWSQLQTTFELLKCNRLVGAPVARRPHIRTAIQEAMRVAAGCRGTGVPANIGAG